VIERSARLDFAVTIRYSFVVWVGAVDVDPRGKDVVMELPKCQKCNNGVLIPLSDYGRKGPLSFSKLGMYHPDCGFSLRVDKGEVSYGKKIEHKH